MKKPCLSCGKLYSPSAVARRGRCEPCQRANERKRDAIRGTPTQRGYGYAYQKARAQVLADNPWCVYCGRAADTVDHVTPLAKGGDSQPDQLVSACRACNSSKAARNAPSEWVRRRRG